MNLLTLSVGEMSLALVSTQIRQVAPWGASSAEQRLPLAEALGLSAEGACGREVLFASSHGTVAFGVEGALVQRWAEPGSIIAPPRVLRRLRAPSWLAGFFTSDGPLALIVDLTQLSNAALSPREPLP